MYQPEPTSHESSQFPSSGITHGRRTIIAPRPALTSPRMDTGTVVSHRRPRPDASAGEKGHDSVLASMMKSRKPVVLVMDGGKEATGIVVRRDRFTVTLERDGMAEGCIFHEIFYKHAIASIKLPEFNKEGAR